MSGKKSEGEVWLRINLEEMMATVVAGCANLGMWLNGAAQAGIAKYEHEKCANFEKVFSYQFSRDFANITSLFLTTIAGMHAFLGAAEFADLCYYAISGVWNVFETFACSGMIVICAYLTAAEVIDIFNHVISHSGKKSDGDLKYGTPPSKRFNQAVYLIQVVANVALAIFATSPIFHGLAATYYGYAFVKATSEQWIEFDFSKTVQFDSEYSTTKIDFHYYLPLLPKDQEPDEDCAICTEAHDDTSYPFHGNHTYHTKCTSGWVNENIHKIIFTRLRKHVTYNSNGGSSTSYYMTVDKQTFPGCPLCRECPKIITENLQATIGPWWWRYRVNMSFA